MSSIWVPGKGEYDVRAYRVDKAVSEYNERLSFEKNPHTGDWCVFIRMPSPEQPVALMGFEDQIPEPDVVVRRLYESDSLRHGEKIYNEAVKSQEAFKAHKRYLADQASEESAEVLEHFLRKHGKSPVIKSLPKGVSDDT
jgi:hypothetical protein